MKKLCAVIAGVLAFFLLIVAFKGHMGSQITENKVGIRDLRTDERYSSSEVQKLIIEENTLPIFGSSELVSLCDYSEKVSSFLNGDEMNVVTIGAGYFQSLFHTIAMGSMSESIESGKVALFLSPQWFDTDGYEAPAFASRMSEDQLLEFISNDDISDENKQYVLERAISLLGDSPTQLKRVERYQNAIDNKFSLDFAYMSIMREYWNYRAEFEVFRQLDQVDNEVPSYDLSAIDFDAMLDLAEQQGQESCTNNDFGIRDGYWDTYVADSYATGEVTEKYQRFTESPEYADLKCFLEVANDLGLEVILVSIPVNGKWYEFKGQLCDEYYENIRQIARQYDHVDLVDMTEYADEPYFLQDIMHLGWKGWARINEALYSKFVS